MLRGLRFQDICLHLKFSILFHRHLEISQLLDDVRNVILSVCGVDKQWHAYITTFLRCFVYLLLAGKD